MPVTGHSSETLTGNSQTGPDPTTTQQRYHRFLRHNSRGIITHPIMGGASRPTGTNRDTHQDKTESFELPGMKDAVRCVWAEDGEEDPCYANPRCMCFSVVTCWAACWFYKMRGFMCNDTFIFRKLATSFR